jgi:ADP-heptose:LPS heptosyltransferase
MEPDVDEILHRDGPSGLVTVPRADIVRIGQAMARCRLVIAPDTGPMHLASAVGSRTLALFLDSDVERYGPIGPNDRWIDARGGDLSPAQVLETALSMLRQERAAEVR